MNYPDSQHYQHYLWSGMRCLGIPNTAHFANVTQIEDAMALWEKLKIQKFDEAWKPDQVKIIISTSKLVSNLGARLQNVLTSNLIFF